MSAKLTNSDPYGRRWNADRTISVRARGGLPMFGGDPGRSDGYEIHDTLGARQHYTATLSGARDTVAAIMADRAAHRLEWSPWEGNSDLGWHTRTEGDDPAYVWVAGRPRHGNLDRGLYYVEIKFDSDTHSLSWLVDYPHLPHRQAYAIAHAEHRARVRATQP